MISCAKEERILEEFLDHWVATDGGLRIRIIEDELYIVGDPAICKWKLEHLKDREFKLFGSHLYEKGQNNEYIYKDLGKSIISRSSDSLLTVSNFKDCSIDVEPITMRFMNASYYANKVDWDSVSVINHGDFKDTELLYRRQDLDSEKREKISEELAILFHSDIEVYSKFHGRGIYHTIKVYSKGMLIYNEQCTLFLRDRIPYLIQNK